MGISRASQSPATIQRSLASSRLRRRDLNQVRCLWWWGKRSRGWWASDHDELEERLRRHQALMMHRCTKIMKRRSLWDRDNSPSLGWRLRGYKWDREMSSTDPSRAKVEERDTQDRSAKQPWQEFQEVHKDFESFRKAVDRAIERDPYGTLFGRRLRSPETPNNSSWTSWSWIFDPKEIKEAPKPASENQPPKPTVSTSTNPINEPLPGSKLSRQPQPSVEHSSSSSKTTSSIRSSQYIVFQDRSSATTEYVYDPITSRKVPQTASTLHSSYVEDTPIAERKSSSSHKTPQSKTLLQTIFGEHGIDIPVKTYKPPKVYGYTGEQKQSSQGETAVDKDAKRGFETSKKRAYDNLRLRTMGNNIDATNFNCEPWRNQELDPVKSEVSVKTEEPVEKKARTMPTPDEDAPLFSGTTYASRVEELQPSKNDWLAKEGFRARQGMTMPSLKDSASPSPAQIWPTQKMEPAIDRASGKATEIPIKKFASKLQPSMDRVMSASKAQSSSQKAISLQAPQQRATVDESADKREDIDLLRASDIRAASKAARVTKQDFEERKIQERQQLEKDFKARKDNEQAPLGIKDKLFAIPTSSSRGVGAVWKHVKDYPNGIVARTMQSMGLMEVKQDMVQPAVIEKKETNLSPVLVPNVSTATIKPSSISDVQLQKLGSELKKIYENENGSIDAAAHVLKASSQAHSPRFSEPTVKPGIQRDLAMEHHTQVFEPAIASIVDKAKNVKRQLHDLSLSLGDVVNQRAITEVANQGFSKKTSIQLQELYGHPFIVLHFHHGLGRVNVRATQSVGEVESAPQTDDPIISLDSSNDSSQVIQLLAELDKNNYHIIRSDSKTLVFQKQQSIAPEASQRTTVTQASASTLPNRVAAAEAAAQPDAVKAANVLDEIPSSIPTPGPAAPTAPVPTSSQQPKPSSKTSAQPVVPLASISKSAVSPATTPMEKRPSPENVQDMPSEASAQTRSTPRKSRSRVNRQEQVFSGQQRLKPQTTALPDPEHFQKQRPASTSYSHTEQSSSGSKLGWFARFRRAVKRTILTGLAFGTGAYGIGVIAEALQAKAQIANSEVGGPMKRLVLEDGRVQGDRQRSGIYSTESSR